MIRIAVSPRAYRAIKGTLPEGSVVLKPERDERGRYLMLDENTAPSAKPPSRRIAAAESDALWTR